jgi:hypothetical protein
LIFLIFLQAIEIKSVLISYWNPTGCSEKKLSKNLTQTFMAYGNVMICQQATLSGEAERPKVADAVIEADFYALLDQVVDLLRSRGRVSYRALQRQFGLDDAYLDSIGIFIFCV